MHPVSLPPIEAMKRLLDGNDKFLHHHYHATPTLEEIAQLDDNGQHPWVIVIACSDSRVPPELMFDCGLGDMFVIRTAGHVLTDIELGSVEYAASHLGVRLVVLLGHSHCGAVAAALSGGHETGALAHLLEGLAPAVASVNHSCSPEEQTLQAERAHIAHCANRLREDPDLVKIDGLVIVEAKYDTHTGTVAYLDEWSSNVQKEWQN